MAAELAVQKAILARLLANATLRTLLAPHELAGSPTQPAVYDFVDQDEEPEDETKFPYVVVGDQTAAEWDTDGRDGQEHTVTLHVWDRYRGTKRVKEAIAAIYLELHNAPLVVEGFSTVYCFWEFSGSVPDPDVLTRHGITRFRIITQEN